MWTYYLTIKGTVKLLLHPRIKKIVRPLNKIRRNLKLTALVSPGLDPVITKRVRYVNARSERCKINTQTFVYINNEDD